MRSLSISLMASAALLAGCVANKPGVKGGPSAAGAQGGAAGQGGEGGVAPSVDVQEASIKAGREFAEAPDLQVVHFDYDAYQLSSAALETLQANANYLKAHADMEVLVEGHCDERGTIEYNLALGQKRAKAVRDYYIRLGLPGRAVATLSYGKERLPCSQSTEECWAKSRRAQTMVRSRTAGGRKK